jgi:hypothetical protein
MHLERGTSAHGELSRIVPITGGASRLLLLLEPDSERCVELGAGSAAFVEERTRGPLACRRPWREAGNDAPYLTVNTKFWEVDSLKQDVWHTVFRTVHVRDEVKAWEHDALHAMLGTAIRTRFGG